MSAEKMRRGVFITGTDTGVGKTLFAAALACFLRQRGLTVGVMKPVETGVADPDTLGADGMLLQWASESPADPELISPYRFAPPLAPAVAAEQAGVRLDPGALLAAGATLAESCDFLIVEGAGGLMVPLSGGVLMADLARQLGYPLLTVCRPGLGTINHTLLTLFAARTMELPLAGFVINGMPAHPDAAEASAPHTLASLASADLLGVLSRIDSGSEHDKVTALAAEIATLPTLPWLLNNLDLD